MSGLLDWLSDKYAAYNAAADQADTEWQQRYPDSIMTRLMLAQQDPQQNRQQSLQRALQTGGLLGVPIASDISGLLGDILMYKNDPESRTPINYSMTGLGLLPFIPGSLASISGTLYRGGKAAKDGQFYSRAADYAKGFDKGSFGAYKIDTSKAIRFGEVLDPDDVAPIIKAMTDAGDSNAAKMIHDAVAEDGGVMAENLYQWLERLGSAAPEYYLTRAGIEAIDTGRDVRALIPEIVQ